MPKPFIHLPSI